MPRKRYTPEEVIQHLRTVELDTGQGLVVLDACRNLGITEQTYYRWKKEYGGLRVDQAQRPTLDEGTVKTPSRAIIPSPTWCTSRRYHRMRSELVRIRRHDVCIARVPLVS